MTGQESTNPGELILYQTADGKSQVQVRLVEGTVWLSQRLLSELYQVSVKTVNEHLINIYDEGELHPQATIRKFRIVQIEGEREVSRLVDHYRLEAILALGYRVRTPRGVEFRKWATTQLQELLVKGFVMDDERLKEGRSIGADYFEELLARIRDIRASEKRFYQKIKDIYTLAIDYDANADATRTFFQTVQNKLHWAITGLTAAEIITQRADANKPNMGLTNWQGQRVRKSDVGTAKNYLAQEEIEQLNRIITMYLDYAELQVNNRNPLYMADWQKKLDGFLQFNEQNILTHAGKVSSDIAQAHAEAEYARFNQARLDQEAQDADAEDLDHLRRIERNQQGDPSE